MTLTFDRLYYMQANAAREYTQTNACLEDRSSSDSLLKKLGINDNWVDVIRDDRKTWKMTRFHPKDRFLLGKLLKANSIPVKPPSRGNITLNI